MSDAAVLTATVARIKTLVDHFHRDLPFRAPEAVPEHQSRLLNQIWGVLVENRDPPSAYAPSQEGGPDAS